MGVSTEGEVVRRIDVARPTQGVLREQTGRGEELVDRSGSEIGAIRQILRQEELHVARGGGGPKGKGDGVNASSVDLERGYGGHGDEGIERSTTERPGRTDIEIGRGGDGRWGGGTRLGVGRRGSCVLRVGENARVSGACLACGARGARSEGASVARGARGARCACGARGTRWTRGA